MAGLEVPTSGRWSMAKTIRTGYLSQLADLQAGGTLYQEMVDVFAELRAQQAQLHRLEHEMVDPQRRAKAMERYGELLQRFELAGGYEYEQQIRHVLCRGRL
jgi:ATP-binding cassette subfamily F protein 3